MVKEGNINSRKQSSWSFFSYNWWIGISAQPDSTKRGRSWKTWGEDDPISIRQTYYIKYSKKKFKYFSFFLFFLENLLISIFPLLVNELQKIVYLAIYFDIKKYTRREKNLQGLKSSNEMVYDLENRKMVFCSVFTHTYEK